MDACSPAVEYLAQFFREKALVREQWRKDAGNLLDAHQFAFSAIVSAIRRHASRKIATKIPGIDGRMSLTAQFVQGIDLCEVAISEGLYSQAAALLKQEMEIIEAVNELSLGRRRDGTTPKLDLLRKFGKVYGQYNEFAHASVSDIAKLLVFREDGDLIGPSLTPLYNKDIAVPFYGMHVLFIIMMARQIGAVFEDLFDSQMNDSELKMLYAAIEILKKEDIIQADPT